MCGRLLRKMVDCPIKDVVDTDDLNARISSTYLVGNPPSSAIDNHAFMSNQYILRVLPNTIRLDAVPHNIENVVM